MTPWHAEVLRRLRHATLMRALWWDKSSDECRRGLNRAVDSLMKDAVEAGIVPEAREIAGKER